MTGCVLQRQQGRGFVDIYSLTIAHINTAIRPARLCARAEDRYYCNHMGARFRPELLGLIAIAASAIMMLSTGPILGH